MIDFIKLKEEHLEQVLEWRTKESVTRFMYTDIDYNLDNQKRWFEKVSKMPTEKYWIISIKGNLAGVISLNDIDFTNRKTSWGFYIGEDNYRMYGGIIPQYLYNYVFNELNLNKITAEVMEGNNNIIKIHKLHGYREVGYYKTHILKNGKFQDVHLMELLKEQWNHSSKKSEKYNNKFED
ncbi:UDP-4-amino-4,6-dideoxy-N-acetyl-beta-L-altrosamine N-acetyltransferase [Paenibacillus sp. HWE-109]|uniref:UDP-4-amino-4, 6-dideoxy-N-acetyl-beta-L-altrosamine N-acetyltransferase n=1 Tax=Paenibacillus sp. HWE-109 TaxID=1306526 RepID=UPI001EDCC92F|nr:UDP-4-amino-4,6-dideoxy-N-acetyl-beta-L-altrosamine N-acetyltransferase [Paenibacillus sp. HWE-109]UKS25975.1 UDP-4-amino-4,6-dideoxy-N-acetyl-beta-L-altrosamine N-acetyltransferase [Paenibacillus sp. HWE-109]